MVSSVFLLVHLTPVSRYPTFSPPVLTFLRHHTSSFLLCLHWLLCQFAGWLRRLRGTYVFSLLTLLSNYPFNLCIYRSPIQPAHCYPFSLHFFWLVAVPAIAFLSCAILSLPLDSPTLGLFFNLYNTNGAMVCQPIDFATSQRAEQFRTTDRVERMGQRRGEHTDDSETWKQPVK